MTTAAAVAAPPKNGTHPAPPPPASTPPKFVASQLLDVSAIEPDPHNPRKDFPAEAMRELVASVTLHGVRSPIEVRQTPGGKYRIVFGERRYRAAKTAGLKQIPAIVRTLTDIEAAEVQLDENLKRADLSPLEVAGGYARQLELGRTIDQVCERAGKKRTQVYAMLQLLQLGDAGRAALGEEKLTTSVAQLVARVPKALQERALGLVLPTPFGDRPTHEQAEKLLRDVFTVSLKGAAFDPKDAKLVPAAGACGTCPKRSGNARDLFPDVKGDDVCTDRACFDAKVLADARRAIEAKGWTMLSPMPQAFELFHNEGRGPLRQESGWVDPKEPCHDDANSRPYGLLLTTEQLKKLVRVALDADGKPRQLLERAGLLREVKRGGQFQERRKLPAPTTKEKTALKDSAEKHAAAVAAPSVDDLVDTALVAKAVEVFEKRGPTPALLRLLCRELLGSGLVEVFARRGLKDPGAGRPSEKEFEKTFGALPTPKVFGLLAELVLESRYLGGDGFEDVAEELGIDVKKVRAEIESPASEKCFAQDGKEGPKNPPCFHAKGHEGAHSNGYRTWPNKTAKLPGGKEPVFGVSLKELVKGKSAAVAKAVAKHAAKKPAPKKAAKKGGKK
jgi:ParB/RepB/Spo0J family partition protein